MPAFQLNTDSVSVSADFIENKMTDANGAYVKVYLYMLLLASRNLTEETSSIAKRLNLLESDVVNAIEYWSENGALIYDNDKVIFGVNGAAYREPSAPVRTEVPQRQSAPIPEQKAEQSLLENKALADLCTLSQEILGKTLSSKETETLFWLYDYLGLSPDTDLLR